MAFVFNLRVLVDEKKPEMAKRALIDALNGCSLDAEVSYFCNTNASLDDSIVNETYQTGDAFENWLVVINIEGKRAYWSNQYGWTSIERATRFDSTTIMPRFAKEKGGVFILENGGQ